MGREMIAVGATRTNNRNMEIFSMSGNKMKILTKCIYTMHRVLLALLLLLLRLKWRGLLRVSGRWIWCRPVSQLVYPVSWSNFRKLFMLQVFSLFFLRLNLKTLSWRYIKNNSFGPDRFSLVLGHIIGGGSACFFVDYLLSVIKSTR